MGTIYLLHFDQKYCHVQHYIGYAEDDLMARLDEHAKTLWQRFDQPVVMGEGHVKAGEKHGAGALLLGVINAAGIGFKLVRTWQGDRTTERLLKNRKNAKHLCPICYQQSRHVSLVGHPDQIHV